MFTRMQIRDDAQVVGEGDGVGERLLEGKGAELAHIVVAVEIGTEVAADDLPVIKLHK